MTHFFIAELLCKVSSIEQECGPGKFSVHCVARKALTIVLLFGSKRIYGFCWKDLKSPSCNSLSRRLLLKKVQESGQLEFLTVLCLVSAVFVCLFWGIQNPDRRKPLADSKELYCWGIAEHPRHVWKSCISVKTSWAGNSTMQPTQLARQTCTVDCYDCFKLGRQGLLYR